MWFGTIYDFYFYGSNLSQLETTVPLLLNRIHSRIETEKSYSQHYKIYIFSIFNFLRLPVKIKMQKIVSIIFEAAVFRDEKKKPRVNR